MFAGIGHAVAVELTDGFLVRSFNLRQSVFQALGLVFFNPVTAYDGDLFLSTTITLQLLSDRIVPGTHMIFDELLGYKGYEKHELLALYLWMVDHKVLLCSMGHKGYIDAKEYIQPEKEIHQTEQSVWFQVLEMT